MDTSFLAVTPRDRFELFDKSHLYALAGVDEESATTEECACPDATSLTRRCPDCQTGGRFDSTTLEPDIAPDKDVPGPDEDEPAEDDEDDEDDGIEPSQKRGGVGNLNGGDLVRDDRATVMTANELGNGRTATRHS